jgi:gas vesicle protein
MGLVWGALTSAAVTLLLAPQSGETTQERIRNKAYDLRDDAERTYEQGRRSLMTTMDQARQSAAAWLDQGSEMLQKQAEDLRTPVVS